MIRATSVGRKRCGAVPEAGAKAANGRYAIIAKAGAASAVPRVSIAL